MVHTSSYIAGWGIYITAYWCTGCLQSNTWHSCGLRKLCNVQGNLPQLAKISAHGIVKSIGLTKVLCTTFGYVDTWTDKNFNRLVACNVELAQAYCRTVQMAQTPSLLPRPSPAPRVDCLQQSGLQELIASRILANVGSGKHLGMRLKDPTYVAACTVIESLRLR